MHHKHYLGIEFQYSNKLSELFILHYQLYFGISAN